MALVNMQDMLEHAYRNRYAVGAFDLVGLEFLEAIIRATHTASGCAGLLRDVRTAV